MESQIVPPGEGRKVWVVGDLYTFKATGEDTGGAFALIEALVPPGGGPPPHSHSREDEAFYVLEGTLHFQVDDRELDAGPGTWITLPKGSVHAFKNTGTTTARMLIHVAPSGLERYFLEVGREATDGGREPVVPTPEDFAKLLAVAPKYGLDVRPPSH